MAEADCPVLASMRRYVDNLQTVRTTTLLSLQHLPPNLRKFLTRTFRVGSPINRAAFQVLQNFQGLQDLRLVMARHNRHRACSVLPWGCCAGT
jgi:hypothetical protein